MGARIERWGRCIRAAESRWRDRTLADRKVWSKCLWILGNYSRFVRPGFMRVSTSGTVPSGVLLTAYTIPADGTVAVVAVNNTSAANLSVFITGAAPCSMTPYVTSSSDSSSRWLARRSNAGWRLSSRGCELAPARRNREQGGNEPRAGTSTVNGHSVAPQY